MSAPPISSPSTNSCGMVGQPDSPESSWRMRGSGRMSSAAYWTPSALSAPAVRAENPQAGCWGVPFMKSITGFSSMALEMKSRISSSVTGVPPGGVDVLIESAWIGPPTSSPKIP